MPEASERVQVLYALRGEQILIDLDFTEAMTAADAVERSGLAERYPEITEKPMVLGIWGIEVALDCRLRAGDRVEISRPLVADPRDMRRELVSGGRVMGGAAVPETLVRKTDPG